ncbi:NAD(P)-dependent alcohol dehydrogenase [Actinomyces minihominis]|uniref:NAD(P)-dependent alcohol dehydrogenase n=1 Tax=Actinomyces minihominis TaxID=2002838 RepID=UPI000C0715B5|nr:NAD(P)-dependent alcohol dehydrogenase [Actinomyces minihominis]
MPQVRAFACDDTSSQFHPHTVEIREPGPTEVFFDVKYAGICHSDIHTARGEWGPAKYPLVPGHELAGVVAAVGDQVTKFKIGDHIGVGCMTGSCISDPSVAEDEVCEQCREGHENFCTGTGTTWTYGDDREGNPTSGGYAQGFTVDEKFGLHIPESIPLVDAAPLLCAGITTYSPLKRWGAGPGKKVAVVGMGGLGHMGVQLAAAMGADVSVISQTRSKEEDARKLGAHHFYASGEEGTLKSLRDTFDIILCTVSASDFDYNSYFRALKAFGVFINVGLPEHNAKIDLNALITGDKVLAGSNIGGILITQEMLDFCAEHGIASVVEVISGDDITQAYDDVVDSKVRYRYVIDTATFNE